MSKSDQLRNEKKFTDTTCDCQNLGNDSLSKVSGGSDEPELDTVGGFYCNFCGLYCSTREQYLGHMRIHTR